METTTILHNYLLKHYQPNILFVINPNIKELIIGRTKLESIDSELKELIKSNVLSHWGKNIYQLNK